MDRNKAQGELINLIDKIKPTASKRYNDRLYTENCCKLGLLRYTMGFVQGSKPESSKELQEAAENYANARLNSPYTHEREALAWSKICAKLRTEKPFLAIG